MVSAANIFIDKQDSSLLYLTRDLFLIIHKAINHNEIIKCIADSITNAILPNTADAANVCNSVSINAEVIRSFTFDSEFPAFQCEFQWEFFPEILTFLNCDSNWF